jgi:hypothetical protein
LLLPLFLACMTTSLISRSTINTETMQSRLEAHPLLTFATTPWFSEPIAGPMRMHHTPSAYSSCPSGGRLEAAQAVSTRSQTWRILIQLQVYGAAHHSPRHLRSRCADAWKLSARVTMARRERIPSPHRSTIDHPQANLVAPDLSSCTRWPSFCSRSFALSI